MKKKTRENTLEVLSFLGIAYQDYIASRVLFNNDLLVQACIFATTSIEKYFKAIIKVRGNTCGGHNISGKLLNSIQNYDPDLYNKLNKEFIMFLNKAYSLRYLDSIKKGFNIVITRRKTLAELDYTVSIIEKRFNFHRNNRRVKTGYDRDIEIKEEKLLKNNYILQGINKKDLIEQQDSVFEMKMFEINNGLQATYKALKPKDDGIFMSEALRSTQRRSQ